MLDQYLISSPSSNKFHSVPSTVSTVISSQKLADSLQMTVDLSLSPPACMSYFSSVKNKLPVTLMDPPLPISTRFIDNDPNIPTTHKLLHGALCNPNELRATIIPDICYGCK